MGPVSTLYAGISQAVRLIGGVLDEALMCDPFSNREGSLSSSPPGSRLSELKIGP